MDIDELITREQIRDLLATFCRSLDEYRVADAVSIFLEDCTTDYGPGAGGILRGRAAFLERVQASHARFRRTHHQLGQTTFRIDGDVAHTLTYVHAWHERHDGSQDSIWLRYDDDLVRTADGWRISARRAHASGVDGFPGSTWRFVERLPIPEELLPRPAQG
jgi:ketosteroid isomerase-like protein